MFDIYSSGYDSDAKCFYALAVMFDGERCRVRCNGFDPASRTIEHQSSLDIETLTEICDKITKEIYRLHINPALKK